jgi:hypothetical protein
MAESAALLVDEVFPEQPVRQLTPGMACSRAMQEQLPRVLSFPFPLRFLFASRPAIMGQVLGIVCRCIATHLIKQVGLTHKSARAGAVTLVQRFGSVLNLNVHLMCMDARMPRAQGCAGAAHMLFLDGVYVECPDGSLRFRWVKAPTSAELRQLTHTLASRVGRFLERQGLLERDAENSYLIDIETCRECGGAMKVIACIEDAAVIKKILDHLKTKDETREPFPLPESRAPPFGLPVGLFE